MDLAELQNAAAMRGYSQDFGSDVQRLSALVASGELRITDSMSFDFGTDPGDDATMYLIEGDKQKGYLILSDSFHVDPEKATLIDTLLARR